MGGKWYHGFMKRYGHYLARKKYKVRDAKRLTWCTHDNFSNMYDCVYESMVSAKVAEKLDKEIMFDAEGKETNNVSEMVGLPTKYKMLRPECCLFVDETGSTTNQKEDGHVGGQLFILPTKPIEGACVGAPSDIRFTVLCFTSGTGEPGRCAVILKSSLPVEKLPIQWTFGLDIRKNAKTGKTESEMVE